MPIIQTQAYARAGLIGNPSDGYHGKTISFVIRSFAAEVTLYESPELRIQPNQRDLSEFNSLADLARDVRLHGYYGGVRLLKATLKRFHDYCLDHDLKLDDRNCTVRYHTNIPAQVGLAGSSAIICACLRALMQFYGVDIPKPEQPNLILSVETKELGIPAGLQDRVVQTYEGLVYMDFNQEIMAREGHGHYEEMDPRLLPPLYIAYQADLSEGTEVLHNDLRGRFNQGEPAVLEAMRYWAGLSEQVRALLLARQPDRIAPLLNANFDKRREICRISQDNIRMVDAARSVGASAKFTGSGGAIVGTYEDQAMYQRMVAKLEPMGIRVLKPTILP